MESTPVWFVTSPTRFPLTKRVCLARKTSKPEYTLASTEFGIVERIVIASASNMLLQFVMRESFQNMGWVAFSGGLEPARKSFQISSFPM